MQIVYIDETGDGSISRKSLAHFKWFILAGMAIDSSQRMDFAFHTLELKRKFWPGLRHFLSSTARWKWTGTSSDWQCHEIKGSYLEEALRKRKTGKSPTIKEHGKSIRHVFTRCSLTDLSRLVSEIVITLDKFRPTFYFALIDKGELLKWASGLRVKPPGGTQLYTPVAIAYTLLEQRIALSSQYVYGGNGALLLADEQTEHEKQFPNILQTRDLLTSRTANPPDFRTIIERPLWVRTRKLEIDREILQFVDIAAHAVRREAAGQASDGIGVTHFNKWIARHWGTGQTKDAGLTVFPQFAKHRFPFDFPPWA